MAAFATGRNRIARAPHKALLDHANALHQAQTISSDNLSDLLELADGALAYAVETMPHIESDE
jgi:hypothetical protein